MKRGQTLLAVVMWAGGISLTTVGVASTLVASKFNQVDTRINNSIDNNNQTFLQMTSDIAALKADVELLVRNQGLRPYSDLKKTSNENSR